MGKIVIDSELCKSCGYCVLYCPKKIIEIGSEYNKGGYKFAGQTDEGQCTACAMCAMMCPDTAINVYK